MNRTNKRPGINELGADLLNLSFTQLTLTLVVPFILFALYFIFAFSNHWIPAVLCTVALSFTTYGSTSHDLVHKNLKLNNLLNEFLLTLVELICFRSGHAYKASHLYHHKRYPHEDDIEGSAARMSLFRALLEGVIFQFKLYGWALKQCKKKSRFYLIVLEGVLIFLFAAFCIYSYTYTLVYGVYFCLMVMGSWIIPLITSYAVHTPHGNNELNQTRLFRGKFFSILAFEHLYHLEHHLYPMVPHKNWRKLSERLDPYFKSNNIEPIVMPFHNSIKIDKKNG